MSRCPRVPVSAMGLWEGVARRVRVRALGSRTSRGSLRFVIDYAIFVSLVVHNGFRIIFDEK
eukprot:679146-Prymnesium_polylepis.1